jgi:hypothetical protein
LKATFIVAGSEVTVIGALLVGLVIVTLVTESLNVVVATSPDWYPIAFKRRVLSAQCSGTI